MEHKHTRRGFTLIELLVVVLIIGILAAVAVPQYKKAVLKSRYATLKPMTYALKNAQEVHYLAHGKYAENFNQLDVDTPAEEAKNQTDTSRIFQWGQCDINATNLFCRDKTNTLQLQMYYKYTTSSRKGIQLCIANTIDLSKIENKLCKEETRSAQPFNVTDTYVEWKYK